MKKKGKIIALILAACCIMMPLSAAGRWTPESILNTVAAYFSNEEGDITLLHDLIGFKPKYFTDRQKEELIDSLCYALDDAGIEVEDFGWEGDSIYLAFEGKYDTNIVEITNDAEIIYSYDDYYGSYDRIWVDEEGRVWMEYIDEGEMEKLYLLEGQAKDGELYHLEHDDNGNINRKWGYTFKTPKGTLIEEYYDGWREANTKKYIAGPDSGAKQTIYQDVDVDYNDYYKSRTWILENDTKWKVPTLVMKHHILPERFNLDMVTYDRNAETGKLGPTLIVHDTGCQLEIPVTNSVDEIKRALRNSYSKWEKGKCGDWYMNECIWCVNMFGEDRVGCQIEEKDGYSIVRFGMDYQNKFEHIKFRKIVENGVDW